MPYARVVTTGLKPDILLPSCRPTSRRQGGVSSNQVIAPKPLAPAPPPPPSSAFTVSLPPNRHRCINKSPLLRGATCVHNAGLGSDGLMLGDTVGRTPGAYGFIVSCDLTGYVGPADVISGARLIMTKSGQQGINPLGGTWTSNAGPGPAKVLFSMVGPPMRILRPRVCWVCW
jgi:hypothetical protein